MFIAALFTIAKKRKQTKSPSREKWIKMWYIYTMDYLLAIKRNEIVPCAETWMNLEAVIKNEARKTSILY